MLESTIMFSLTIPTTDYHLYKDNHLIYSGINILANNILTRLNTLRNWLVCDFPSSTKYTNTKILKPDFGYLNLLKIALFCYLLATVIIFTLGQFAAPPKDSAPLHTFEICLPIDHSLSISCDFPS